MAPYLSVGCSCRLKIKKELGRWEVGLKVFGWSLDFFTNTKEHWSRPEAPTGKKVEIQTREIKDDAKKSKQGPRFYIEGSSLLLIGRTLPDTCELTFMC